MEVLHSSLFFNCVTCVHMSSSYMALGEDGVGPVVKIRKPGTRNLFAITKVINGRGLKC